MRIHSKNYKVLTELEGMKLNTSQVASIHEFDNNIPIHKHNAIMNLTDNEKSIILCYKYG